MKSGVKSLKLEVGRRNIVVRCIIVLLLVFCMHTSVYCAEKWTGVDETVVEKYAKEHGREAHKPLINTDQGDLLLFVFLIAGTVGGFVAGYYWRILMVEKAPTTTKEKNSTPL